MHTFADLAKTLNRSTVYLSGLQSRFDLLRFDWAGCSLAYFASLQRVVHLRTPSITEGALGVSLSVSSNMDLGSFTSPADAVQEQRGRCAW